MKIKKIKIKKYKQFKDIEIDLTYPKGHEKEGQALDKVCIIGRSGTGKTSLFRLIRWFICEDRRVNEDYRLTFEPGSNISIEFEIQGLHYHLFNRGKDLEYAAPGELGKQGKLTSDECRKAFRAQLQKQKPYFVNFPADLVPMPKRDEIEKKKAIGNEELRKEDDAYLDKIEEGEFIDFIFKDIKETWDAIMKDIRLHRADEIFRRDKIAAAGSMAESKKAREEYKKWLSANPSPLINLATHCLDPILKKLGAKVKTEISIETILELGFIELQSLTGKDIPRDLWSTGTRQLILTLLPLFQLKPRDAVILLDEPERSLYPDIQLNIVEHYTRLAPGCQFFFATHSPFIASCFEPWEIVELKFDSGYAYSYRDLNYKGERQVDNYDFHPQYLRWDSNLLEIFEIAAEGGKKRQDALQELAQLNIRIKKLKEKNELQTPGGQKLVDSYLQLSAKLAWDLDPRK